MSADVARRIRAVRKGDGRVIPVGTTAVRTLEAYAQALEAKPDEENPPEWLSTRLLITPGYRFRWCDGMMTNFHLPGSTLMALVAAMLEGGSLSVPERGKAAGEGATRGEAASDEASGVERLKRLYAEAVLRQYRFYSFGDAMLIV